MTIAVAIGAVPGALSRYYLTVFWAQRLGIEFPYGTFFVNLTGAFLIGALVIWLNRLPMLQFLICQHGNGWLLILRESEQ